MQRRRLLPFSMFLVLGICPLVAEAPNTTLTMTFSGTLGPILLGSDPLSANGQTGSLTIMASESLAPSKNSSDSATYTLPGGSVSGKVGGIAFTSSKPATMTIKLTSTADILKVTADGPLGSVITGTAYLAAGSWPHAVFQHPSAFSPSSQNLTPATTLGGPGSTIKYTFLGSDSILGLTGTGTD
jgi:hypothetical protein